MKAEGYARRPEERLQCPRRGRKNLRAAVDAAGQQTRKKAGRAGQFDQLYRLTGSDVGQNFGLLQCRVKAAQLVDELVLERLLADPYASLSDRIYLANRHMPPLV